MISSGLARLAAVGAAALTVAGSGLVATPAAAAGAPAKKPAVSVSTPTASPQRHFGRCPATVTFSAKVRLKVKGTTTLRYRWLRGDGSTSAVKTRTVKGSGTKTVTVAEKATFTKDVAGWQALQVVSPRKLTTKKAYFSVACDGTVKLRPAEPAPKPKKPEATRTPEPAGKPVAVKRPAFAKAFVHVPDYAGECPPSRGLTAKGLIKVGRPTVVTYRWIRNGKVVGQGKVKVVRDRTVTYTFTPTESHRGRVTLDIVSPRHGISGHDGYAVKCAKEEPPPPPVEVAASATAPEDYSGACPPVTRVFTGTVSVSRIDAGGTAVQYRWAGPDFVGPTETLTFAEGDPLSKDVSHPVQVTESGVVQRWIEVLSPGTAVSNTAETQVTCEALQIQILNLQRSYDVSACTPGNGPAINFTSRIRVNGPVRVEYRWEFLNGSGHEITVPGSVETTGPDTVTVSHRLESSSFTNLESSSFTNTGILRARISVTSHPDVRSIVTDFSPPPCPSA